jgi:hypothetical protein
MAEAQTGTPAPAGAKKGKWWASVLWGLGCEGLAAYLYFDLTQFETQGGTKRMNVVISLVYNMTGKWGVVGLFAAFGIFLIYAGVKQFRSGAAKTA